MKERWFGRYGHVTSRVLTVGASVDVKGQDMNTNAFDVGGAQRVSNDAWLLWTNDTHFS